MGRAVHPATAPKMFNLRTDPYERADTHRTPTGTGSSTGLPDDLRRGDRHPVPRDVQGFPPRQEPATFTITTPSRSSTSSSSSRGG